MGTALKKYTAIRYNTATGFNPSQWDGQGRANLDPVWLVERLALFDTYCAPSLESQTLKDFCVLIAFDAHTHENYIRTVCDCVKGVETKPVLIDAGANYNDRFNAFVQDDTDAEFVALTRLDSDDALAPDFMERVDHYARREIEKGLEEPLYIAFPHGQNFDTATRRYTRHEYAASAFGTLVERRAPAEGQTGRGAVLHGGPAGCGHPKARSKREQAKTGRAGFDHSPAHGGKCHPVSARTTDAAAEVGATLKALSHALHI